MDKNTKKTLALLGILGASIAAGIYTQNVSWDPAVRFIAHATGGIAVPGISSLLASGMLSSYESFKDKRLLKEEIKNLSEEDKEKHLREREPYKMKQKTYDRLMKVGMLVGSLGYMGFSASWEMWQYSSHNVFQLEQYLSDTLGPIAGMATIGAIDIKPLLEKINKFEEKAKNAMKNLFSKGKDKEKNIEQEKQNSVGLKVEEIVVDEPSNSQEKEEQLPAWDMRNYSEENQISTKTQTINFQKNKDKSEAEATEEK